MCRAPRAVGLTDGRGGIRHVTGRPPIVTPRPRPPRVFCNSVGAFCRIATIVAPVVLPRYYSGMAQLLRLPPELESILTAAARSRQLSRAALIERILSVAIRTPEFMATLESAWLAREN